MKNYRPTEEWHFDPRAHSFILLRAGEYDPGREPDKEEIQAIIRYPQAMALLDLMEREGFTRKARHNERVRDQDVGIINRLIDALDKAITFQAAEPLPPIIQER